MGLMSRKRRDSLQDMPVNWLPIDSRLVLPLFSFGHVRGLAKVFLTIEMALALCVVFGTLVLIVLHVFF